MNDREAERQIEHMISFIKKEAEERVEEIQTKTNAEFTAEKQRLVEQAKVRLREEFAARKNKALVQKRIARSLEINRARIRKMEEREKIVRRVLEEGTQQAATITKNKELIQKLIVQGLIKLMDTEVRIETSAEEEQLVNSVLEKAIEQYKSIMSGSGGRDMQIQCRVTPSLPQGTHGVRLTSHGGRIVCSNTLETRVALCYEELKPQVRAILFGIRQ